MHLFFELEIAYIIISIFILSVTAFVTSLDFVAYREIKNQEGKVVQSIATGSFKKGMSFVFIFSAILISFHYNMATSKMNNIENMFNNNDTIICENKMHRTISNSVLLSKKMGWRLENHLFKNPEFKIDFFSAHCVEWIDSKPQREKEK